MRVGEYIVARVVLALATLVGRVILHALAPAVTVAGWLIAAVICILLRPVWRELANALGRTRAWWSPTSYRRTW